MDRLTKNFLWLLAANMAAAFFNTLTFIYLARVLGAEPFGYLSYTMTLIFYLFNFVDLGLSTFGTRETAKNTAGTKTFVSNIVSFRFLIASALFFFVALITLVSRQPLYLKALMIASALMLYTSAFATEWAFQGAEKMHMVFVSLAVTTFLQFTLNCVFVRGPDDLLRSPILTFLATIPIIFIFLRKLKFAPAFGRLDFDRLRSYLRSSLTIWGISVFAQAYNGLDIVILGLFRSPSEVGYFTVARRAIGGISMLMIFLANAMLPRLSSSFLVDRSQFDGATKKFLQLSLIIMFAVLLPLIFTSDSIISFTVGNEYLAAGPPFKVMTVALFLVLLNLPYSTALVAAGFERAVLKQAAASASVSVISNFILIPKYGMIGAAISFMLAETLALIWVRRVYAKKFTGKPFDRLRASY